MGQRGALVPTIGDTYCLCCHGEACPERKRGVTNLMDNYTGLNFLSSYVKMNCKLPSSEEVW
jgi:hypothetical protein